jgi:hypothetical protein
MKKATQFVPVILMAVTWVALLDPQPGSAQQILASTGDAGRSVASETGAGQAPTVSQPSSTNTFIRPGGSNRQPAEASSSSDSLGFAFDRKWASTAAQYTFTAPPAFYNFTRSQPGLAMDWNSALAGAFAVRLSPSGATAIRMTGGLETFGERRGPAALANPGGQSLTVEWEFAHALSSKFGPLELAAGAYKQRLISYPGFADGPTTDVLLGYSAYSTGLETSLTLPDKNFAFSLRYGKQNLAWEKSRTVIFEFSWGW